MFASLRRLHDTGIAHHDLRPGNLFMSRTGAGFCSLDAAEPGAGELARRIDLVQALATLASTVGPADAVTALRAGYGPVDQAAVAAVLQPLALAPWGWRAMRAARGPLNEIRHELLGDGGVVPTARLERFRWRTVASTVALTVAAYLLIGEISGVNVLGTLGRANPAWLAVAVLGSAVTYLAAAENLAAFVPRRLSIWRGFCVQLSTAFVGLAMPPTVGHVAVNARYLHREQVDEGTIAAAVTMSQIVNVVTTVLLLIVFGLLTGSGFSRFKIAPGGDVLIGLAVIAAAVIVVLAVPQTRAKLAGTVWPHLRAIWPRLLDAASHPLRLAVSAGANLLLSAAYLVAFIAALRSVGAHPAILAAAVVYLAGNAVGSAAPTPGGLGGVEAVLAAGLTAIGIPVHEAIPAVLIFRIATFWLPIPVGWICYLALRRRGVLLPCPRSPFERAQVRAQHGGDARDGVELVGGERVDEEFPDRAQMGHGGPAERGGAVGGEDHLRATAVGGALLAADQTAPLHPAEVVGQAAALPGDLGGQLRGAQPLSGRLAEGEQDRVVPGRQ